MLQKILATREPSTQDIGGCEVAQALVIAVIVVVIDEGVDLHLKVSGQVIVLQQDAVLQRLMWNSYDLI